MNHAYRTLWSDARSSWVAVPEFASAHGKSAGLRAAGAVLLGAVLVAGMNPARAEVAATALPSGGQVTAGTASIAANGTTLNILQTTQKVAINWQTFNIGSQATVNFQQPSSAAIALNRVLGQDASQIMGRLNANGQVFIINPNGVLFGKDAQVNVGGLVASTRDLGNEDFLAGRYRFSGDSTGTVLNQGSISTASGGYVALIGAQVRNEGRIDAPRGDVRLAAGNTVTVNLDNGSLTSLSVDQGTLDALADNHGLIRADGGRVYLTAKAADSLIRAVVNNDGIIEARTVEDHQGTIVLLGDTALGDTRVGGTLDASAADGTGGRIAVTGEHVLIDEGAHLNASGTRGGGEVLVGGGWQGGDAAVPQATATTVMGTAVLEASATDTGNGGTVVAWSNIHNPDSATRAWGSFLARGGANGGDGGRIETSGHWLDTRGAQGSAAAPLGAAGLWLFDPYDVTITSANANGSFASGTWTPSGNSSTILNTDINSLLEGGTSVTVTTGSAGSQIGDITVGSAITKASGNTDVTLTLRAANSISVDQAISNTGGSGKLNVVLDADNDNGSRDGAGIALLNNSITTGGGNLQFGTGATLSIGGVTTLVGGDVYVGGSGAVALTTGGGNVTVNGEMIIANTSGLTISTANGNVNFGGLLNSGNSYSGVTSTQTWSGALTAAMGATSGTDGTGDTYLATVTSRLENALAARSISYNAGWLGARRIAGIGADSAWRWVSGPEGLQDSGNGLVFFNQNGSDTVNGSGGTTVTGLYSNWSSGEPNNYLASNLTQENESALQFTGTQGNWNDLPKTGSTLNYYVRETNLAASPLTINAGTGAVSFSGAVGGNKALASLAVTAGSIAINGGAVTTSGTQTYSGAVTLGADSTLATTNSGVSFSSTVDSSGSAHALNVSTGAGTTTFSGVVGGNLALASLAAGTTAINTSAITTNGAQTYSGAVTLGYGGGLAPHPTTLSTTNSNVTFASTLDALAAHQQELTVAAGSGTVTFAGAVGAAAQPWGLYVTGSTVLSANLNLGRAEFFSPVTIGSDLTLTQSGAYGVHFHDTINGAHALTVNVGDGVSFDGAIGGLAPLSSLSVNGPTWLGGNVTTTGSQSYAGDVTLVSSDTTLTQTAADTHFVVQNGRSISNGTGGDASLAIVTTGYISLGTTTNAGSSITSTAGKLNVTLNADSDATNGGSVWVPVGSSITSNGGDIKIGGGSNADGYAVGYAQNSDETNSLRRGVALNGTVDAGGGNITVRGQGQLINAAARGVNIDGAVSTSGSGTIAISGTARLTSDGVYIGGSLAAANGNITVTGARATGSNGINIGASGSITTSGSGDIGLTASSGALNSLGTVQAAGGGDITLLADSLTLNSGGNGVFTGSGGLTVAPYNAGTTVGIAGGSGTLSLPASYFTTNFTNGFSGITVGRSDGTGAISVNGLIFSDPLTLLSGVGADATLAGTIANAGSGTSSGSLTVRVGRDIALSDSATVTTQNQDVVLNADSDASLNGAIALGNGSRITTNGGNIVLGGGADPSTTPAYSSSAHPDGVVGFNRSNPWNGLGGSHLSAGGGDVSVNGYASGNQWGVDFNVSVQVTTSGSGTISIVGNGGSAGGGVVLDRSTLSAQNGDISITGTTAASQYAVTYQAGSAMASTGSGAINVTGIGGLGLTFSSLAIGGNSETGNITLTADKINLSNSTLQSSGSLTLQPYTAGTTIGLGTGAGTLSLPASYFSTNLVDGFSQITVGSGSAGAITIGSTVAVNDKLALVSGGNIAINAALNASGQTLILTGAGTVSGSGNVTASGLLLDGAGSYALNTSGGNSVGTLAATGASTVNFKNSGSLAVGTVGGTQGVSASGNITLEANGASADLTLDQAVTTTSGIITLTAGRDFINNKATDTGIVAGSGRYLVYSASPSASTEAMTGYSKHYNQTYSAGSTPAYAGAGNWFLYSVAPTLTVTADNQGITYGAADPALTASYTGFIDGDTAAILSGASGLTLAAYTASGAAKRSAGTHAINAAAGSLSDSEGYLYAFTNGTLTVAPKSVTVSGSRSYDATTAANGADLSSIAGMLSGDAVSLSGTGSVAGASVASNRAVTVGSLALAGADAANYSLAGAGNTLSITPASLTLSTSNVSKTYDGTTGAAGVAVVTAGSLYGSDSLSGGSFAFVDPNAGSNKTVTVAGISVSDGNGGGNYSVTYASNITSAILARALTVTANNDAKTIDGHAYSGGNGVTFSGFAAGEGSGVLTGVLGYGGSSQGASAVGNYLITPAGLAAGNYDLNFISGILTIALPVQAPSLVTAVSSVPGIPSGTASSGESQSPGATPGEAGGQNAKPVIVTTNSEPGGYHSRTFVIENGGLRLPDGIAEND